MRLRLLYCIVLTLLCSTMFAQRTSAPAASTSASSVDKDAFMLKSKRQKTAGWIMLGSGLTAVGLAAATWSIDDGASSSALAGVGAGSALASLTMFRMASKNKKKADMVFRSESIPFPANNFGYVSVGLSFNLAK